MKKKTIGKEYKGNVEPHEKEKRKNPWNYPHGWGRRLPNQSHRPDLQQDHRRKGIQIMERHIYGNKLWKHTHTYMKHTEYQIDKTRNKIPNGVS